MVEMKSVRTCVCVVRVCGECVCVFCVYVVCTTPKKKDSLGNEKIEEKIERIERQNRGYQRRISI